MVFKITSSGTFAQQAAGLQRCNHSAAQGFTGTGVAGSQVDNFQAVLFTIIRDDDIAIGGPNFFLGIFLGVSYFAMNIGFVRPVEIASQNPLGNVTFNPLPGKPVLNLVPEIASRFAKAPNEGAGIKLGRSPS